MAETVGANFDGDHLCVLVHGLWGNPTHMEYISIALTTAYPSIHLLVCKRNSGMFTYDGIETGGERVTKEIEETLEDYEKRGVKIRKLSIVGYSLGGLVSRYAIGLLYSRGWFNKVKPVNFTTFATPHLGVRTPLLGWHNHIWNVIGARVLSVSGRQLFLIDNFRETGRPLLSILADKDSAFYRGLACFPNKVLYANIVNDRSTCFYTSAISRIDPFVDMSAISVNFVSGYAPIIVDPAHPVGPSAKKLDHLPFANRMVKAASSLTKKLPKIVLYIFFVPLFFTAFLVNAFFQTLTSKRRIRLHNSMGFGKDGYHSYRDLPLLLVEEMQEAVEGVIEDIHQMQEPEHLSNGSEENAYFGEAKMPSLVFGSSSLRYTGRDSVKSLIERRRQTKGDIPPYKSLLQLMPSETPPASNGSLPVTPVSELMMSGESVAIPPTDLLGKSETSSSMPSTPTESEKSYSESVGSNISSSCSDPACCHPTKHDGTNMEFTTLALAPSQFTMVENLDQLSFRKFPVWIHQDIHAHAAMIVRTPCHKSWEEGKVVIRHWLTECFLA